MDLEMSYSQGLLGEVSGTLCSASSCFTKFLGNGKGLWFLSKWLEFS